MGECMVDEKTGRREKPDPEKIEALRSLPKEIVGQLTKEEVTAFLFDKEWPDSLRLKLKDYIE